MWGLLISLKGYLEQHRKLERMLGSTISVVLAIALVLVFTRVEANYKAEIAAVEVRNVDRTRAVIETLAQVQQDARETRQDVKEILKRLPANPGPTYSHGGK